MTTHDFAAFARRIVDLGFINDPWIDGSPRFDARPTVLSSSEAKALLTAGEDLAAVIDEAVQLLLDDDDQRAAFLPLLPTQAAMLQASQGLWHGLARADVFFTDEGLQVTELNSDTPTGEPEAIVLGYLGREDHPTLDDPCAPLPSRLAGLWQTMHRRFVDDTRERTAAIIYPTEFTEDLSLIRLYQQLLQESGWRVVLGSPYNLGITADDRLELFGEHPSLVVRHYKTDWWSERQSVWIDDDVLDPAPLVGPLTALVRAQAARTAVVVNPLGCIASQSKRLMAFCWERIHRFSVHGQQTIQRLIPYTARLESIHEMQLRADKDRWVIKSDYGAEGDEVIIGRFTTHEAWEQTLVKARPGRFIAQQYFEARRDPTGSIENHGVFVVAGEACGIYTRRDRGLTDATALSVPTLVRQDR